MLLAVVLDREMRGSRFYQTAFYMPVVLSLALIGFIWQLFYSRDQGLINQVFGTEVDWYGDPDINLWAVLVATAWRHTGYIMLIYLAGLKGVDDSLREAAAVDGASEVKTFFQVILPVMRPINMIVVVIVVIESLRAFDLVWVINKGRNGLEIIAALVSQNVIGEATRYGFGSALAVIMMLISSVFIAIYLRSGLPSGADQDELRDPGSGCEHRPRAGRPPTERAASGALNSRAARSPRSSCWCWRWCGSSRCSGRCSTPSASYDYTQANGYLSFGGWTLRQLPGRLGARQLRAALPELPATSPSPRCCSRCSWPRWSPSSWPGSASGSTSPCSASSSPRTCCRPRRC